MSGNKNNINELKTTEMKKLLIISILALSAALSASAQNRFGIMGGVNMSNTSTEGFSWRTGGYLGGLYDIQLTPSWYVQPQLIFSYEENKSKGNSSLDGFYSQYAVTLPVLASYNIGLGGSTSLRINAGPYLQYAMFGRDYQQMIYDNNKTATAKGWWHQDFSDHFTYGVKTGLSLDFNHVFVSADYKYSLRKSMLNADGHGSTFSIGLGYKF